MTRFQIEHSLSAVAVTEADSGARREHCALLRERGIQVIDCDAGLLQPGRPREQISLHNALGDARTVAKKLNNAALAEFSTLRFHGGVFAGLNNDWVFIADQATREFARLESELTRTLREDFADHSSDPNGLEAVYSCYVAVAWPDAAAIIGSIELEGRFTFPGRAGDAACRYEPIFVPDGNTKSLGEMGFESKLNLLRRPAFREMWADYEADE